MGWLDRWRPASCIVWGERQKKSSSSPIDVFPPLGEGGAKLFGFFFPSPGPDAREAQKLDGRKTACAQVGGRRTTTGADLGTQQGA